MYPEYTLQEISAVSFVRLAQQLMVCREMRQALAATDMAIIVCVTDVIPVCFIFFSDYMEERGHTICNTQAEQETPLNM